MLMFLVLKRWQDGEVHFRVLVPFEQDGQEEGGRGDDVLHNQMGLMNNMRSRAIQHRRRSILNQPPPFFF
ncbi:MAG: hypothetical protein ACJ0BN_15100 [Limisphaerales bacterium]|jgi:hypothetical protein|nr:hypothetical protein [Verrucomicrobiae bacterium]|tara:strand:+ start:7809 stop:8018 length:210 start_codon:yes stop_codon:yes gene_type:complete